jgi:hypothetical protein
LSSFELVIHTPTLLTRGAPWSAPGAEPPENEFAFAQNPFTERARGRLGHVVPLNVLNIPAAVADEVVMPHTFRIESRGAALDGHFTHQTRLDQVPQILISRGPGRAGIHSIHGLQDFRSRGMPVMFRQKCHHSVALWSTPQPAAPQGTFNRLGVHEVLSKIISNVIFCFKTFAFGCGDSLLIGPALCHAQFSVYAQGRWLFLSE